MPVSPATSPRFSVVCKPRKCTSSCLVPSEATFQPPAVHTAHKCPKEQLSRLQPLPLDPMPVLPCNNRPRNSLASNIVKCKPPGHSYRLPKVLGVVHVVVLRGQHSDPSDLPNT